MPEGANQLENLYCDNSRLIISASEKKGSKEINTWISYNNGKIWKLFDPNKSLGLINNSLGEIFLIDSDNKILKVN